MIELKGHNSTEYQRYLDVAKEKLTSAQQLNLGIPNLWNGLGVCILEEAHNTGDLSLIEDARNLFNLAFELNRSPINLATKINNLSYANIIYAFYNTIDVVSTNAKGVICRATNDKDKILQMKRLIHEQEEKIDVALSYSPNSTSILFSKAELLCNIALFDKMQILKIINQLFLKKIINS